MDRGLRQDLAASLSYLLTEIVGPNAEFYREEIRWFELDAEITPSMLIVRFAVEPTTKEYREKPTNENRLRLPRINYEFEQPFRKGKDFYPPDQIIRGIQLLLPRLQTLGRMVMVSATPSDFDDSISGEDASAK